MHNVLAFVRGEPWRSATQHSPITVCGLPLGQLQETARFSGRGAPAAANSGRIISIALPSHSSRVSLVRVVLCAIPLGLHDPNEDVGLVEPSAVVEHLCHCRAEQVDDLK